MEDRRIFERLKAKITLKFSLVGSTKQIEAESMDISGDGIGFITKENNLTPNTSLEILLIIPGSKEPLYIKLKDKVAWSKKLETMNCQRVGAHLEEEKLMNIACVFRLCHNDKNTVIARAEGP
ncbi:MAG: PilZ domain-containing protein, partial [Candidatus Omnitrophota bacterium]|nr:PilZ domain-containing protein [Candidatus Omnitrophota bacterium]